MSFAPYNQGEFQSQRIDSFGPTDTFDSGFLNNNIIQKNNFTLQPIDNHPNNEKIDPNEQYAQERDNLMKQYSQKQEELLQQECSRQSSFENMTHSILDTAENPDNFLDLGNANSNIQVKSLQKQQQDYNNSVNNSRDEIETNIGDEEEIHYKMEGQDPLNLNLQIKQEHSTQQLYQSYQFENNANMNTPTSAIQNNNSSYNNNNQFDLSSNNQDNNIYVPEQVNENPQNLKLFTPEIRHQKVSITDIKQENFKLEKPQNQHTNIISVMNQQQQQQQQQFNQYKKDHHHHHSFNNNNQFPPRQPKTLFKNSNSSQGYYSSQYNQQNNNMFPFNVKKENPEYEDNNNNNQINNKQFNLSSQSYNEPLKYGENCIKLVSNDHMLKQKNNYDNHHYESHGSSYGHPSYSQHPKYLYKPMHQNQEDLKAGTNGFIQRLENQVFSIKTCESEAEKKIQLLSRKKDKQDASESQKFRNMKKLVMNGILKYFVHDILKQFNNIPDYYVTQIARIAEIIKDTGKNKIKDFKKMDLFSQPHFNALFLCINEKSCESMAKNKLNIELHQKIFNIKITDFHSLTSKKIEEINVLKSFMYLVAKYFLQKNTEESEVKKTYKRIVLISLEKMVTGQYINKFQSYKAVDQQQ